MTARPRALEIASLYSLRATSLWQAFREQGLAFWLLCSYLMLEYVRPQAIYPILDGLPLSMATLLATAGAVLFDKDTRWVRSPANVLLGLYTVVVLVSSALAVYPQASVDQFVFYFSWLVVYALFILIVNTEVRLFLVLLLFVLFNLKMSLFATRSWIAIGFAFRDWGVAGSPGWFQNSGEFGIEMCVFFPIVVYLALGLRRHLSRWKLVALFAVAGTAVIGIVASSSRGAMLGIAAVVLWMTLRSRHKVRTLFITALIGAFAFAFVPDESKARFATAGEDGSSVSRLTYWKRGMQMARDFPALGIGYGNWIPYYATNYGPPVQVCHNIFVQAASELGYTGLVTFLLLIGCTLSLNRSTRRRARALGDRGVFLSHLAFGLDGALLGFLVSGFFVTVLYYPFFWINLAMTVATSSIARRLASSGAKQSEPLTSRAVRWAHVQ